MLIIGESEQPLDGTIIFLYILGMDKDMDNLSDEELIEGVIRKDSTCLGALYSRYFQKVNDQCQAFVKDRQTAFDLSQDILLKAFLHLPEFRKKSNFAGWLWAIGNNHCKEYARRAKQHHALSFYEGANTGIAALQEEDPEENLAEVVHALLDQLAVDDREMLILKYGHNTSIQELRRMYKLSESAIKMRLRRAKEKLSFLFYQKHLYPAKNKKKPA